VVVAFLIKSELASTTLSMTKKRKSTAVSDAPKGGAAVVVVGSANVDLVMTPRDLPSPGVTVLAPTYRLLPGGKGANQAYACAKLGHPRVKFVGATGDDDFANIVLRQPRGRRRGLRRRRQARRRPDSVRQRHRRCQG